MHAVRWCPAPPIGIHIHTRLRARQVWAVDVSEEEQQRRLVLRRSISEEEARERIDAQVPAYVAVCRAHVILTTEGCADVTVEAGTQVVRGGLSQVSKPSMVDQVADGRGDLIAQAKRAMDGAHARAAQELSDAVEGSAAREWHRLCAELRVPPPAARRWWRILLGRYACASRYCHNVDWLRRVVLRVDGLRGEASRPTSLALAAFFARADAGVADRSADAPSSGDPTVAPSTATATLMATASGLLSQFATYAPGLDSADVALASRWVDAISSVDIAAADDAQYGIGAKVVANGAPVAQQDEDRAPRECTTQADDWALLLRAHRDVLTAAPAEYARYASSLLLERRCQQLAGSTVRDGVGSHDREVARRLSEIKQLLKEPQLLGVNDEQAAAAARANLESERRWLQGQETTPAADA